MKRILLLFCIPFLLMAGSCSKFDPTNLWESIDSLEDRVTALEKLCKEMNTNISALQSLVSALENRDYITDVAPIMAQDKTIGYTINFAKGNPITIYNGKDGEDGKTPVIGVRQDVDGVYYWTLGGEWLLDDRGNKVVAQGGNEEEVLMPQLKIENNKWYVSYNKGVSWTELGTAIGPQGPTGPQGPAGEKGDSIFQSVEQTPTSVIFVLADGQRITIPKAEQGQTQNPVTLSLDYVSGDKVVFNGTVSGKSFDLKVVLYYGRDENLTVYKNEGKAECVDFPENKFNISLEGLAIGVKYYYFYEVLYNGVTSYSAVSSFTTSGQVESLGASANCYIVSKVGKYQFKAVKGNGSESVGNVASAEVVWETFGTDVQPSVGDLIASASYEDGNIVFETATEYRKGNALIAAKDVLGAVLWSWHIWFTDKPLDHVYNNDAGIMMDRNLGATSATPGDACAIGLCYQWGRKDPFLTTSSVALAIPPLSTLPSWPAAVTCDANTGTIEYSIANPTTFIKGDDATSDWCFGELASLDVNRWSSNKTIYDPCPAGYRVPDGGDNGIWAKAAGTSDYIDADYDFAKKGINVGSSSKYTPLTNSVSVCWYPNAGSIFFGSGKLSCDGKQGYYWSVTDAASIHYSSACDFCLYSGDFSPSSMHVRSYGQYVRCAKE